MQDQYQEDDKTGRGETREQITDKRWERKRLLKKRALRLKLYKAGVLTVAILASGAFVAFRYHEGESGKKSEASALRQDAASEASGSMRQGRAEEAIEKAEEKSEKEKSADAALFFQGYQPKVTAQTQTMPEEDENMTSEYAILVNLDNGEVVAQKNAQTRMYPASMTKILTLLTAAEQIQNPNGSFTIDQSITDYVFSHGCSAVNWGLNETVSVSDLMHGTIMPSGADAALALSLYAVQSRQHPESIQDFTAYAGGSQAEAGSVRSGGSEASGEITASGENTTSGENAASSENAASGENTASGENMTSSENASSRVPFQKVTDTDEMKTFVSLMNEKVKELGLSNDTHFTNVIGVYDDENYCTAQSMAMIMKAAMENKICRDVMSAHRYQTQPTPEHPDGLNLSNLFLRRIEDKEMPGEVICAKTGFVNESGSCAASYFISNTGRHYICVTGNAHSSWRCIYDHVTIYNRYAK